MGAPWTGTVVISVGEWVSEEEEEEEQEEKEEEEGGAGRRREKNARGDDECFYVLDTA